MKTEIMKLGKTIGTFIVRNSPHILMGGSLAGLATTVVFAIKDTNAANPELRFEEEQKGEQLTFKEKVKVAYKYYWKTGIAFLGTGACIIGGHTIQEKRMAALAALYTLSETTLKDYKDTLISKKGEKEEKEIHDAIMEDRVRKINPDEVAINTGMGTTVCYDTLTGRSFLSSMNAIKTAVAEAQGQLYGDLRLSLNEWYDFLRLDHVGIGNEMGWSSDEPIKLIYTSMLTSNGTPVLVMDYETPPVPWYMHL